MRLIDADALKDYFFRPYSNEDSYSNIDIAHVIDTQPTIEPDPDTVSRQQTLEHIKHRLYESALNNDGIASKIFEEIADNRVQIWVDELQPSPNRPKGHWIKEKMWSEGIGMGERYGFNYSCSECKSVAKGNYNECGKNFCPNCGADMRP